MKRFKATYVKDNEQCVRLFSSDVYDKDKASEELKAEGIQNFFLDMDPIEPRMLSEDSVLFTGEVGLDITLETMEPFLKAGNKIYLDSFGGDLFAGLQIHDAIKELYPNAIIGVLGSCASAATVIFCAAKLENRSMSDNSRFLIHNALTLTFGNHNDFRLTADMLEKESNNIINNIYVPATGRSFEELKNIMDNEIFLTKSEVMALNFIAGAEDTNNNIDMTNKQVEETLNSINATLNAIKNKVGLSVKAIVLSDVNGVELDFSDLKEESEIIAGVSLTANGEAANGEYVMPSGVKYVCEKGVLNEIIEPEEEEVEEVESSEEEVEKSPEELKAEIEELKAEIERLKAELEGKDSEVEELKVENVDVTNKVNDLNKVVNELKNKFPALEGNGISSAAEIKNKKETKKKFSYKKKS